MKKSIIFILILLAAVGVRAQVANAGPDITVYAGEPVRLDGSASTGYSRESLSDGTWSMRWSTGDGYDVENMLKAPHVYMQPGVYTAVLALKDAAVTASPGTSSLGTVSTDTVTVTVFAVPGAAGANVQTLIDTGNPETNKANLQQALNVAALNPNSNEIVVPAGFVANDPIILPARDRSFGTYVTVRAADLSALPPLQRVTANDRSKLFKIDARPAWVTGYNQAIVIPASANYYRFIGMEINRSGGEDSYKNDIIAVEFDPSTEIRPSHLIFDRMLIDVKGTYTVRAFAPNSEYTSLLNSSILNVRTRGVETKAVGQWSGNGPLGVINNRLEAAAINFLVGGATVNYQSEILDGLVFRGNHSWKDPAWVGPNGESLGYTVKNLWELKAGHNSVCAGNIFENNYTDGQSGEGILIKSAAQDSEANPWAEVRNLDFRNNKILNSRAAFSIVGIQSWIAPHPNYANHIRFVNNFWSTRGGRGNLILSPHYFELIHNTFVTSGSTGQALYVEQTAPAGVTGDYKAPGLKILNNLMPPGEYGAIFSSYGQGYLALDYGFSSWDVRKNTFSGGIGWQNPAGNYDPTDYPSLFRDYAVGDYALPFVSIYRNAGTDSRDIGADMPILNAETATASSGFWTITPGGVPTATVAGRIRDANGRGLSKVHVLLTGAGENRSAISNPFGYFEFDRVVTGQVYTVTISHKRYRFPISSQQVLVNGTILNLNFGMVLRPTSK